MNEGNYRDGGLSGFRFSLRVHIGLNILIIYIYIYGISRVLHINSYTILQLELILAGLIDTRYETDKL